MDIVRSLKDEKLFSKKELILKEFILNHIEKIPQMNIRELSSLTDVSTATIVRFTRKFGVDGFDDFKYELIKQLSRHVEVDFDMYNKPITRRDTSYQVIKKITAIEKKVSNEFRNEVEVNQIVRIATYINNASRVTLYGSGINHHINEIFSYSLLRIGKRTYVPNSSERQLRVSLSNKEDVAIFLSHHGKNEEYFELIEDLSSKGCDTFLYKYVSMKRENYESGDN